MPNAADKGNAILAFLYFLASTVITWWFVAANEDLYKGDYRVMFLSCGIAGAKWGVQIVAALLFLGRQRWAFLHRIGFTCLIGSIILVPAFLPLIQMRGETLFLYLLIASVLTMMVMYYYSVRRSGISIRWFFGWLLCLAIAITLQLTVVFHVV